MCHTSCYCYSTHQVVPIIEEKIVTLVVIHVLASWSVESGRHLQQDCGLSRRPRAGQALEKCAEKLSLSRQQFTFCTFYCRYIRGCTLPVTGIMIADSCFPGRSVRCHSFFVLDPSRFLCSASYSPSQRFWMSLSEISWDSS